MFFSITCDYDHESDVYTEFIFRSIHLVERIRLDETFVKLVFDCVLVGYDFTSSEVLLYKRALGAFRRTLPDFVLAISCSYCSIDVSNPLLDIK